MFNIRNALLKNCCALVLGVAAIQPVQAAEVAVRTQLERAYGYVIGDVIEQRVQLDLPEAAKLDAASLPKPGKLNAWVELRSAEQMRGEGPTVNMRLRYQLMNSPREVVVVFLPAIKLQIWGADNVRSEVNVAAQAFSISPLSKDEAFARAGMESMRPAREVQPIATRQYEQRVMQALALAALLAAALTVWLWLRNHRHARGPFARAAATIASLKVTRTLDAMIALHEAFNVVAGKSVFAQSLSAFFVQQPHYAEQRSEIEAFFAMSRAQFFGQSEQLGQDDAERLQWVSALAKRLARLEMKHTHTRIASIVTQVSIKQGHKAA